MYQLCSQTDSLHGYKMGAALPGITGTEKYPETEQRLNLLVPSFEELKKPFQGASQQLPLCSIS